MIHIPLDIQRRKKKGSVNLYYTLMFQHQTNLSYQDMLTHQALHPSLEIQMPQPQNLVISAIKNHSPPNAEYSTHQVSSSTASRLIHSNVEESPHISIWYKAGHAALWCALNTIVYTVAMTGALACTTASAEPCVCASYLSFESLNGVVVKVIMICRHGLI